MNTLEDRIAALEIWRNAFEKERALFPVARGFTTLRLVKADVIVGVVCQKFALSRRVLYSRDRHETVARARQICMMFMHSKAGLSYTAIGKMFKRDHGTVRAAEKRINDFISVSAAFAADIADLDFRIQKILTPPAAALPARNDSPALHPSAARAVATIVLCAALFFIAGPAFSAPALASWYDARSLTCASWFYPPGTRLRVTEIHNGLSVIVTVADRGPARRWVARGVTIDLSADAFARLDGLELGHAEVNLQPVK